MNTPTEIQVTVTQVGASAPGREQSVFNEKRETFPTMEDALAWLEDCFGIKRPKRIHYRNSVFVDSSDGGVRRIGFLVSRWNSDCSHNSKAWWETNWVSFRALQDTGFSI
jgi:hypothetical protein